ncbi:hypothetical protein FB45DRAFT_873005 [Roridomyces roridus]|uniref:Uncharacterized protein n=1 Tax=Roridomyces roridus TaxID=1738132 RepID=A0AAD7BC63_9AGAR|nr:hypothetical protein FB45DRAFT_873005 [Roridomyces roridus]
MYHHGSSLRMRRLRNSTTLDIRTSVSSTSKKESEPKTSGYCNTRVHDWDMICIRYMSYLLNPHPRTNSTREAALEYIQNLKIRGGENQEIAVGIFEASSLHRLEPKNKESRSPSISELGMGRILMNGGVWIEVEVVDCWREGREMVDTGIYNRLDLDQHATAGNPLDTESSVPYGALTVPSWVAGLRVPARAGTELPCGNQPPQGYCEGTVRHRTFGYPRPKKLITIGTRKPGITPVFVTTVGGKPLKRKKKRGNPSVSIRLKGAVPQDDSGLGFDTIPEYVGVDCGSSNSQLSFEASFWDPRALSVVNRFQFSSVKPSEESIFAGKSLNSDEMLATRALAELGRGGQMDSQSKVSRWCLRLLDPFDCTELNKRDTCGTRLNLHSEGRLSDVNDEHDRVLWDTKLTLEIEAGLGHLDCLGNKGALLHRVWKGNEQENFAIDTDYSPCTSPAETVILSASCWTLSTLMPARPWTTAEQFEWLSETIITYREHHACQTLFKFWPDWFKGWFQRWPEENTLGLPTQTGDADVPALSDDDQKRLGLAVDARNKLGFIGRFPARMGSYFFDDVSAGGGIISIQAFLQLCEIIIGASFPFPVDSCQTAVHLGQSGPWRLDTSPSGTAAPQDRGIIVHPR